VRVAVESNLGIVGVLLRRLRGLLNSQAQSVHHCEDPREAGLVVLDHLRERLHLGLPKSASRVSGQAPASEALKKTYRGRQLDACLGHALQSSQQSAQSGGDVATARARRDAEDLLQILLSHAGVKPVQYQPELSNVVKQRFSALAGFGERLLEREGDTRDRLAVKARHADEVTVLTASPQPGPGAVLRFRQSIARQVSSVPGRVTIAQERQNDCQNYEMMYPATNAC